MPSSARHRQQAQANEQLYQELGGTGAARPDWALTVLFYAAVHEIQAFLLDREAEARPFVTANLNLKFPPESHDQRMGLLRVNPPWNNLGGYYQQLFRWSKRTRYQCLEPTVTELQWAELQLQLIRAEIAAFTP